MFEFPYILIDVMSSKTMIAQRIYEGICFMHIISRNMATSA